MNKRLKILLVLLVISIIIAAVYVLALGSSMSVSPDMATTTAETSTSTGPTAKTKTTVSTTKTTSTGTVQTGTATTPPVVLWTFRDKSNPRDTSQLFTAVLLTENGNQYDLGTQTGICKTINDADLKGSGEISAIQCLTAGKGEEIGIFKQGSGYVVKSGKIELGKAGSPDTRGTFTVIQTLK